jgi:hypothetical protein
MSTKEPGVNAVSGHDVDLCDGASTPALKTRTAKPRETRMEWTYYSDVEGGDGRKAGYGLRSGEYPGLSIAFCLGYLGMQE